MQKQEKIISNQDSKSIFRSEAVHKKMKEILLDFKIPTWIVSNNSGIMRKCEYCDAHLDNESIRGIGVCLNAQHFGDIQVEILCQSCLSSYFYNFRKMCSSISGFCEALSTNEIYDEPVVLSNIKPHENNLADMLIADEQNRISAEK